VRVSIGKYVAAELRGRAARREFNKVREERFREIGVPGGGDSTSYEAAAELPLSELRLR
jgi:hypothetical protein